MADIVVEKERSSSAGPIVAIIALLVLGFLVYLAWSYFGTGTNDVTDVEVNTPTPSVNVESPAPTPAPAE